MGKASSYKKAGVDIDAGNRFVELIKPLAQSTHGEGVVHGLGGFSALFDPEFDSYVHPLLVSATDGVGTKLKLAFMTGVLDTVGIDLVAMCVNDLITCGAKPLFFLDYLATSTLEPEKAAEVVKGIAAGCKLAGCALLGGETAEMPGFYGSGEFDLAGFAVGIVDRERLIDGSTVQDGDDVIGIKSSGLHSNGYSLVRKVLIEDSGLKLGSIPTGLDRPLGEELLEPTRIYVQSLLEISSQFSIKAIAHITGGGLIENIPRVLPDGLGARLDSGAWEKPPIFTLIQEAGGIDGDEMYRIFNCGVGAVLIVSELISEKVLGRLSELGETSSVIGKVKEIQKGEDPVEIV